MSRMLLLTNWLLSACNAGTDGAGDNGDDPPPAPYVRLDREERKSFQDAFMGAGEGSTIEFCGQEKGPLLPVHAVG